MTSSRQFMYFCNDSVDHPWAIHHFICNAPVNPPNVWLVQSGTSLTRDEITSLECGEFELQKG